MRAWAKVSQLDPTKSKRVKLEFMKLRIAHSIGLAILKLTASVR